MPFANFNFSVLRDPDFKEDAVREEIISPLLKSLGYAATGKNRIIRSKSLAHPFVHIGTRKSAIKIIPDYLLEVNDKYAWVLDAKGPLENIKSGSHVEQAYSYAIHPDVRVPLYALCNGHELVVFSINNMKPLLTIPLRGINTHAEKVRLLLSPLAFSNPAKLRMKPDYGLSCLKAGVSRQTMHHFYEIGLPSIAKVSDSLYTASLDIKSNDIWYALSFDFNSKKYQELLKIIEPRLANLIYEALTRQPYKIYLESTTPTLNISAKLGEVIENDNEEYCPLVVDNFQTP